MDQTRKRRLDTEGQTNERASQSSGAEFQAGKRLLWLFAMPGQRPIVALGSVILPLQGLQIFKPISASFQHRLAVVNFPTELAGRSSVTVFEHQCAEAIHPKRWEFPAQRCHLPDGLNNVFVERLPRQIRVRAS